MAVCLALQLGQQQIALCLRALEVRPGFPEILRAGHGFDNHPEKARLAIFQRDRKFPGEGECAFANLFETGAGLAA